MAIIWLKDPFEAQLAPIMLEVVARRARRRRKLLTGRNSGLIFASFSSERFLIQAKFVENVVAVECCWLAMQSCCWTCRAELISWPNRQRSGELMLLVAIERQFNFALGQQLAVLHFQQIKIIIRPKSFRLLCSVCLPTWRSLQVHFE